MLNCIQNNTCLKIMYFIFPDCSLCIRKFLSYKTQCPTCCVVSDFLFLILFFVYFLGNLRTFFLWTLRNNEFWSYIITVPFGEQLFGRSVVLLQPEFSCFRAPLLEAQAEVDGVSNLQFGSELCIQSVVKHLTLPPNLSKHTVI